MLTLPVLIKELLNYVSDEIVPRLIFNIDATEPSKNMRNRAEKLFDNGMVRISNTEEPNVLLVQQFASLTNHELNGNYRVIDPNLLDDAPNLPLRIDFLIGKLQKYEMVGMPNAGWRVSINNSSCGCLINFKEGTCVHVLVAKIHQGVDGWKRRKVLVNQATVRAATRATNRAYNIQAAQQGRRGTGRGRGGARGRGRPLAIGNAYQRQ